MLRRLDIRARRAVRNAHLAWSTWALRAGAWLDSRDHQDQAVLACGASALLIVWVLK